MAAARKRYGKWRIVDPATLTGREGCADVALVHPSGALLLKLTCWDYGESYVSVATHWEFRKGRAKPKVFDAARPPVEWADGLV